MPHFTDIIDTKLGEVRADLMENIAQIGRCEEYSRAVASIDQARAWIAKKAVKDSAPPEHISHALEEALIGMEAKRVGKVLPPIAPPGHKS
jgi:hypothetical protein